MTKERARKQATRALAAAEGVSYTTALRRLAPHTGLAPELELGSADGRPLRLALRGHIVLRGAHGTGRSTLARRALAEAAAAGARVYHVGGRLRELSTDGKVDLSSVFGDTAVQQLQQVLTDAEAARGTASVLVLDLISVLMGHLRDRPDVLAQLESVVRGTRVTTIAVQSTGTVGGPARPSWLFEEPDAVVMQHRARVGRGVWSWQGVLTRGSQVVDFVPSPMPLLGPDLAVGQRVQFAGSARWFRVRSVSHSGRYVGLSSPNNLTGDDFYTIVDRQHGVRGPDDLLGSAGWSTDEDFENNMLELEDERLDVSHRHRVELNVSRVLAPDPRRRADPPARLPAPAWLSGVVGVEDPGVWEPGQWVRVRHANPPHNTISFVAQADGGAQDPRYYRGAHIAMVAASRPVGEVVLAADSEGEQVFFDMSRGLWLPGVFDTPSSVWSLLREQAARDGRKVTMVGWQHSRGMRHVYDSQWSDASFVRERGDLDEVLRGAGQHDLIVVGELDPLGRSDGSSAAEERLYAVRQALDSGAWVVANDHFSRRGLPAEALGARLAFGSGARVIVGAMRKRLLAVRGAGLARPSADAPVVAVRAYSD